MIVVIPQQVFGARDASQLDLLHLLQLCSRGCHGIECVPVYSHGAPQSKPADEWLESLASSPVREPARAPRRSRSEPADGSRLVVEIKNVLARAQKKAMQVKASVRRLRIATSHSTWQGPEPAVSVRDALRLLSRPLHLLVENRRNDAAFVRWLLPGPERRALEQAEKEGWVEFEQGGGIQEMIHRIQDAAGNPVDWARLWVLFDHDGTEPSAPGDGSRRLCDECGGKRDPWPMDPQRLERRAAENYLPLPALEQWVESGNERDKADRRALLDAFKALENLRYHYNMKAGLLGDVLLERSGRRKRLKTEGGTPDDDDLPPPFRGLPEARRQALRKGFGERIRDLFHEPEGARMKETWMRAEIGHRERVRIAMSITDRM